MCCDVSTPIALNHYSAAVSIFLYLCCRSPCCPTSPPSPSFAYCLHLQNCLPSPLSCISTTSPLSSSLVYVVVRIALYSIVSSTFTLSFVCHLKLDLLLALLYSSLIFSLSALIFSLRFSLLSWNGSSLSLHYVLYSL